MGVWVVVVEGVRREMMYMGRAGFGRQAGEAGRAAIGWAGDPVLGKYREGWAWERAL